MTCYVIDFALICPQELFDRNVGKNNELQNYSFTPFGITTESYIIYNLVVHNFICRFAIMNNSTNVNICEITSFFPPRYLYNDVPQQVSVWIIFILGVIGNILTVIVISYWRKLHTPTFTMIACLAVSDAFSLVVHFLLMYTNLIEYVLCFDVNEEAFSIFYSLIFHFIRYNSGMQVCLLVVLRFIAIVYPLKFNKYLTCKRVVLMSACGSLSILLLGIVLLNIYPHSDKEIKHNLTITAIVLYVLNFIIPTSLIVIMHYFKARALRRSPGIYDKKTLFKMNIVVSVVFFIYATSSGVMAISGVIYLFNSEVVSETVLKIINLSFLLNGASNPFILFVFSPPIVKIILLIRQFFICKKCPLSRNVKQCEIELPNIRSKWK